MLLVNGANGEFPMLTLEERKQTAQAVVDEAGGRIAVIVGAQTSSTREAIQIAQHAQEIGAAALQVSPPYYFTPTDDDVYEHVAAIAAAALKLASFSTRPTGSATESTPATLERLAEIPQVACIKWGSPDPFNYQFVLLRLADKLGIIDNQLSPVYNQMMGGSGVNVHPALLWPEWGVKVWELLEARAWDQAQAEVGARSAALLRDHRRHRGDALGGRQHREAGAGACRHGRRPQPPTHASPAAGLQGEALRRRRPG